MLRRLAQERSLSADGSIAVRGFGVLDEYESFFRTAITAEGTTDAFLRVVINRAINQEQELTKERFLDLCRDIANKLSNNDRKPFKVIFPVWGNSSLISGRKRLNDVTINFEASATSDFARRAIGERTKQIEIRRDRGRGAAWGIEDLPLAVCSVRAIDVFDAFEQAENSISFELGLACLFSQRGRFIFTDEPETPISTILLAPHMTVHVSNGSLASDTYWYSRWPSRLTPKHRKPEEVQRMRSNIEKYRRRIKKLPWRMQAEAALVRYYAALGQCDVESSFLDCWRLLEAIAGPQREKSEKLVRRAAWFFEDRDFQYQIGLHLLARRNLISHGRSVKENSHEVLAFQMLGFMRPFLHAFLTNPFNFKTIEEFWEFCDLPVEKSVRLRRAHLLRCSARFRREK